MTQIVKKAALCLAVVMFLMGASAPAQALGSWPSGWTPPSGGSVLSVIYGWLVPPFFPPWWHSCSPS